MSRPRTKGEEHEHGAKQVLAPAPAPPLTPPRHFHLPTLLLNSSISCAIGGPSGGISIPTATANWVVREKGFGGDASSDPRSLEDPPFQILARGCQHDGVGEKEVHGEEERHGRLEPTGTNVLQHCTRQKGKEEDMNITYIYTYIPPFFYTANWCAQEDPAVGVAC